MQEKTFTIIDGYGFLFRAYYVLPHLITSTGTSIGGVYGFLNMVLKYITHSDYLTIALDSGKKNFRHDLYPEYKANRVTPPEDLIPQFAILREAVEAFNLSYEEIEGYEADDIIATLAAKYANHQDFKVIVITSDKDLFQLLNHNILIYDPIKNIYIDEKQIIGKFGVNSNRLLDLFSLTGDASDNIPGVPGVGPKTAAKLLNEFGSLENILENINSIEQTRVRNILTKHKEEALISRKLLLLCEKVDLQHDVTKYEIHPPDMEKLLSFLRKYEFNSLINKAEKLFSYNKPSAEKKLEYSSEELEKFLERCRYEGKIAIYCHLENNVLSKISLSCSKDDIFYIDQNCLQDALIRINLVLFLNGVLKIIHDVRQVRKTFSAIEKALGSADDLMTMSYSLDTGKHDHSISSIIAHNFSKNVEVFSAKTLIAIHEKLTQRLFQEKLFTIYERFDKPLIKAILNMEKNEILLNTQKLQELSDKFQRLLTVLKDDIYNLAGERFNITSPKQLSDILFNKMGLNKKKKLKSGSYSTNSEVLEELEMERAEITSKILNWQHLSKLKCTYTDALIKRVDFLNRVHTSFSTTATGSLNFSNPNLQSISIKSKEGSFIRQAFITPKGYKIISADYSQIELRLLAHIANVSAFKEAFVNGQDIHNITARQVFKVREGTEIDKQLRQKAKSINFGIIYGISPFVLARRFKITVEEVAEYIDYYFSCYPEIKVYMEKEISIARRNGYVETLFGRRCFIENINNKIPYLRKFAERAAINAPVQGTAADIIKSAMIRLYDQLKAGKMILQVHNELLIEVEENKVQETAKFVKNVMENAVKISVPLEVEIKISDNCGSNFLNYDLNTANPESINHLN
ncbi:MAG: DNA polymerase I [Wolbachia sp.]